jgi:site-specific DNA-methyltransferase (adenine-specific)
METKTPLSIVTNEDCMDMMARYSDKFFDLAIVDPPYGIDINSSGRLGHYGGRGKSWDAAIPDSAYFTELQRVSKNAVIWGGNYFYLPPTRCFLIWDKQQPDGVSFASCEYAWTSFDASAKTFYRRPQGDLNRIHPTQKPTALYEWILTKFGKQGDRILDTHLGSGTHRVAAHKLGYDFFASEIDEDYFKDQEKRFREVVYQIKEIPTGEIKLTTQNLF